MNLHQFISKLNSIVYLFNEELIEKELYDALQQLNDGQAFNLIPDPCLLIKVKHGAERTKLLQSCTHSKIHKFLKTIYWVVFTILDDDEIETEFSKILNDVLSHLKNGEVLTIEPDPEMVKKCTETRERVKMIEEIFNAKQNTTNI